MTDKTKYEIHTLYASYVTHPYDAAEQKAYIDHSAKMSLLHKAAEAGMFDHLLVKETSTNDNDFSPLVGFYDRTTYSIKGQVREDYDITQEKIKVI